MRLPIYQVDAFADRVFAGNPAAVVPLEQWLPDATLQAIANENNLAETAFFVREEGGYRLRWFTPTVEVDLCGHATIATAHVLFEALGVPGDALRFDTRSGAVRVTRKSSRLTLDFPRHPATPMDDAEALLRALGLRTATFVGGAAFHLVVVESEEQVAALAPDQAALLAAGGNAIVTAPGRTCDFVSRFFAPAYGIAEDPATGAAHCTLIPYWSERLGRNALVGRQLSARGATLYCEDRGTRVGIGGETQLYMAGHIDVPVRSALTN